MTEKIDTSKFIFYGAGQYAQKNLRQWILRGLVPLCFSDEDEGLHYKKISPHKPAKTEFDIMPLKDALELCPDADVYVTINIEADPKVYNDIRNYIISHGVAPESVGPVPSEPTGRKCIFYGSGLYAYHHLEQWVLSGIVPICFADSNPQKHGTKMRISTANVDGEFEVLPIHEALNRYPDAFLYITTDPESYDAAYEGLIARGVPPGRIGAPPQHCLFIGHQFLLSGSFGFSLCCNYGLHEQWSAVGKIREDVRDYYRRCETLRSDLNKGKLTICTGCRNLSPGASNEELKITTVTLDSGMPGATKCNFKCFFCFHGMNFEKKTHERSENLDSLLEILHYFAENEAVRQLNYSAAEITNSPDRVEILRLLKEKKWIGEMNSNGSGYVEEMKELLSENNYWLITSMDSGTPETFARVKGVDAFHKVVENLEKYAASDGQIYIKYILLEGINCGVPDLEGFVAVAERTKANVIIAWDMRNKFTAFSESQYEAAAYMARQCVSRNIPFVFRFDTPEYKNRLKSEGLYPENLTLHH
ncbi:MAG: radical SAM protein [Holophagales bacterium]|jgi:uncharacterized Fe-S radical SAM superfamily protein PflX|nr:radical SAM protein [Holophagales bacterium]